MAYYRSYKQLTSYQRRKHGMRGAKPGNRRPKRRYSRKRRPSTRRRPMSKRSILNTTSQKKRDKMMTFTNTTAAAAWDGATYNAAPAILSGAAPLYVFPFCATGRDATTNSSSGKPNKFDQATRTASLCYMVGLKESIEIQCADGLPWQWRRICFTYKGGQTLNNYLPTPSGTYAPIKETSSGFTRVLNSLNPTNQGTFFSLLFQGLQSNDWSDPMTAKVDTERLTLKYDKTITIASGNEEGVIRKYSRYHPMGKNLMYDDDEAGGSMQTNFTSVESKAGMGDYWVIDIIKPRMSAVAGNQLSINMETTLYWHER
uniref:Capsid protein n=1 Tax=Emberiza rustica Genomoviridae sp. TaxID=2814949 RepID=A0A8E7L5F5_9VIRU|nr:MAG: capsid protein [Gemycircularvirus]